MEKIGKKLGTIKLYNELTKNRYKSNGTIFSSPEYRYNHTKIIKFFNKTKNYTNSNINNKKNQKININTKPQTKKKKIIMK